MLMEETEEILMWIDKNWKGAVKFEVDDNVFDQLSELIDYKTADYGRLLFLFGILMTLAILEYYIANQEFERCKLISDTINDINETLHWNLPTSIHDPLCTKMLSMTPFEIYEFTTDENGHPKQKLS